MTCINDHKFPTQVYKDDICYSCWRKENKEITPDEKVTDYINRAKNILNEINYPKSMIGEGIEMIEVAKMIQAEENK